MAVPATVGEALTMVREALGFLGAVDSTGETTESQAALQLWSVRLTLS